MSKPAASSLSHRVGRRGVLGLSGLLALGGCAALSKKSAFYGTLSGLNKSVGGAPTRAYADGLPYASIRVWFDGRQRNLLVLSEGDPAGNFEWIGQANSAVVTFGPFVSRVFGIDDELRSTLFRGPWSRDLRRMDGVAASRVLSLVGESRTASVELKSEFHLRGNEKVDVFGIKRRLNRLDEQVSSGGIPRYRNRYWFDPENGYCWKSRQLAVPTMPALNIEIVKFPLAFTA